MNHLTNKILSTLNLTPFKIYIDHKSIYFKFSNYKYMINELQSIAVYLKTTLYIISCNHKSCNHKSCYHDNTHSSGNGIMPKFSCSGFQPTREKLFHLQTYIRKHSVEQFVSFSCPSLRI